jgi:hypothetical protein
MSALERHRKTSRPNNAKNVRNARAFGNVHGKYARRVCRAELGLQDARVIPCGAAPEEVKSRGTFSDGRIRDIRAGGISGETADAR